MNGSGSVAQRPRVVVVGAGFGGLSATRALAGVPVDVTLIDRRNFHLFQPLLYQVATAGLTPSDIAWPIRSILRNQANASVVLGEVVRVETDTRRVSLADGAAFEYDWLVVATGATHGYFGNERWRDFAPGLKRVDDATNIRRRILTAFERAELSDDAEERRRLMSFVIIGGGPTGVELAGAIAELSHKALARDFRRIDPRQTRIYLLERSPRVLANFPEPLSRRAQSALESLGVQVRTGSNVTACDQQGVEIDGQRLAAATVLWAAGVKASPAATWLHAPADTAGRTIVADNLALHTHPDIFVIGDTAAMPNGRGGQVPGIAPAAKQAGCYVAGVIAAAVAGRPRPGPFRYRHRGTLATIGRHRAVIDFRWVRLSGWLAWWIWGLAHVYFLIGMRHRLLVAMNWFFSYLTFARGARLIVGDLPDAAAAAETGPDPAVGRFSANP